MQRKLLTAVETAVRDRRGGRVWLGRPADFWHSCMVIQGSNSPRGKNRVTVRRNLARLIPLPRIRGHEPDLSMSDRPLPREILFAGLRHGSGGYP